ncbi:MAG: hypothetical protein V3V88_01975, partial [Dehalococcoidia bacterium]
MMDFKFSEDQEMLRSLARDFLTKECPKAKVRELETDETLRVAIERLKGKKAIIFGHHSSFIHQAFIRGFE